jgi:hypothetical protein
MGCSDAVKGDSSVVSVPSSTGLNPVTPQFPILESTHHLLPSPHGKVEHARLIGTIIQLMITGRRACSGDPRKAVDPRPTH